MRGLTSVEDVYDLVRWYLQTNIHGHNGLFNEIEDCACAGNEWMLCDSLSTACQFAYANDCRKCLKYDDCIGHLDYDYIVKPVR
jgi:hypothetical protein